MPHEPKSYAIALVEILTQLSIKSSAELLAVVVIFISDLIFIYKMATLYGLFKDTPQIFISLVGFVQIVIFLLCLRIFLQGALAESERCRKDLMRQIEETRKLKP